MTIRPMSAALALVLLASCATQSVPESWDGLERVERRGLDQVFVRPGTDLSQYDKVMLDPVEVSFDRSWDPRGSRIGLETADPQAIRKGLASLAREVFREELEAAGGYELVEEPGPDVLRVRAQIVDLYINAPDIPRASATRTYVVNAGRMTLVAELYDSQTNALIARVVDRERGREYGINELQIANAVTNTAEARRVLREWADILRNALDRARGK